MSTTHVFSVPGISCDHCKATIEAAVADLPGVQSVDVGVADRSVTVVGGARTAVVEAIEDVGYPGVVAAGMAS